MTFKLSSRATEVTASKKKSSAQFSSLEVIQFIYVELITANSKDKLADNILFDNHLKFKLKFYIKL